MKLFKDRKDAGSKLAELLMQYLEKDVIVYGLPRGGVVVAYEVAKALRAPLDLIFARKIGHPLHEEFAVGAISENGYVIGGDHFSREWLEEQVEKQMKEIKRRRSLYLNRQSLDPKNRIVIVVDDGVATGHTMEAAILDLQARKPKKIIIALPVSPKSTFLRLKQLAGEAVGIEIPIDEDYLGAVGAYYEKFNQVEDAEVIALCL